MVPTVVGEGEAARTVYVEYMVINGKWETIGDSDVQLVNYYTKDDIDRNLTKYVPFAEDGSSVILTGDITAVNANLQGAGIDGDVGVSGLLTATTVSVVTDADVAGNLTVAGEVSAHLLAAVDALFVSSNVSVVVPLDVDSKATFGADIQVADSAVIVGNLDVQSGEASFGNFVRVESGTTLYAESIVATHIDVTTETAFSKLAIK